MTYDTTYPSGDGYSIHDLIPIDKLSDAHGIDVLDAQRKMREERAQSLLDTANEEGRAFRASEQRIFNRSIAEITKIDRISNQGLKHAQAFHAENERRSKVAAETRRSVGIGRTNGEGTRPAVCVDSQIYTKAHPFLFRDMVRSARGDFDARARLEQYAREPRLAADGYAVADSEAEYRVNPNRTDGQGGYFVSPLWLLDEYAPQLRAGRTFADHGTKRMPLPAGTDSINLPKVSTGASVNVQTADNANVTSVDLTDTSISAPVRTFAGQQDVALQLLEQSSIRFDDQVIFPDLVADYNRRLDLQLLSGTGASGQLTGIDGLTGGTAVTYTDASPTVPELYTPLSQALSLVSAARFAAPDAIFMHPRRWFWMAAALDANSRPLVLPTSNGAALNPLGVSGTPTAEGAAGSVLGVPIFLDANIGTTFGGGTEDRIYIVRSQDLYLWEGEMRLRTLMDVLSGTLEARLQIYNYVAFMPNRYPVSVAQISGSGLVAPAGY